MAGSKDQAGKWVRTRAEPRKRGPVDELRGMRESKEMARTVDVDAPAVVVGVLFEFFLWPRSN